MISKNISFSEIASALLSKKVCLFPFDTIWGLTSIIAKHPIERIYKIKNRKKNQPLLLVINELEQLNNIAKIEHSWQSNIIKETWPGPTTLIFKKKDIVPDYVTANKPTIAIRLPKFEPLNQLLTLVNQPLVSTSANISNQPVPQKLSEIDKSIQAQIDFSYNKIKPGSGIESTIIDLTQSKPIKIR